MNPNTRRRDRGSLVDGVKVGLWFEGVPNARLTELANAAGTTRSAFAQWLIEQCEVDADGVPVGWAEQHPKTEQELPMTG